MINLEIIVAKTAGFCFGVERAVNRVYEELERHSELYTYGPIIHNEQVVKSLIDRGVKVIYQIEDIDEHSDCPIVIRSHGVSGDEVQLMEEKGLNIVDTTCPFVKRIHRIVDEASAAGRKIIIIGNKDHPEVVGIKGWSHGEVFVIDSLSDLSALQLQKDHDYTVVAQTTFNHRLYQEIVKELQNNGFRVMLNETICHATKDRQQEAIEIAKKVDYMIVIGGKHSSNTQKLYQICKNYCKNTYHIETIDDLELNVLRDSDIIGITAGASTPKNIIEEVILNVGRTKL